MKKLGPQLTTFLLDHPMARSRVYHMMANAATMHDDPKMVEWYAPVQAEVDKVAPYKQERVESEAFQRLVEQDEKHS